MKINLYKNTQLFVNINLMIILSFFMFSSCDKTEVSQEIPSYISISEVKLNTTSNQGSNTHNITDVWLYVNDQARGVYPIPANIPILQKDSTNIKIFAGIKDNGISNTRVRYSFYKMYEKDVVLVQDSIIEILPTFYYTSNSNIDYENFEGVGTNIDTTLKSDIDFVVNTENGNHFAEAILDNENLIFECATEEFENLPQVASPVYLELDYKSNHIFTIGAYVNYPFLIENRSLVHVSPKDEWNKIYINLTSTVSSAIDNNSIKFYINMLRTDTTEDAWVKFDNLKIVY
ncbi:MAG: hypothetical protein HOH88_05565 [Flavobacteriales bacterium]|nr:hypothetical protein [Flavobacteriales bacterium]